MRRHLGFLQPPVSLEIAIAHFISDHHRTSLGFIPSTTCTFPFCHILYFKATQIVVVSAWKLSKYVLRVSVWRFMTLRMNMICGQRLQHHWQQTRNVKTSNGKQYRHRHKKGKKPELCFILKEGNKKSHVKNI